MAGPQLEDGYTRIANEILEQAARHRFNGTQLRILLAIWRNTYGYKRKEHEFSLSFLASATKAARSQVDRELASLIERKVLEVVAGGGGKARVLRYNKDSSSWLEPPPKERKPKKPAAPPPRPAPAKKREKKSKVYGPEDTYYKMAAYFHKKVVEMAASIDFNHASIAKADLQKWADEFRLLVENDKVKDKHLIHDVINWVTADSFWSVNVISAKKLRGKFPELALKMKAATAKGGNSQGNGGSGGSMIDKLAAAQEWIEQGGDPYEFNPDG